MTGLPQEIQGLVSPTSPTHEPVLRQSACRVTGFSSQYGGEEAAFAYTSQNLAGETRIYPRYGDCSHAAVFRTFDKWWRHNSLLWLDNEFDAKIDPNTLTEDFIQLAYTTPVYLKAVEIYETFNVGHVVRIYAGYSDSPEDPVQDWTLLWSGRPDTTLGKAARAFVPNLKLDKLNYQPVNAVRLELSASGAEYYPELDAVYIHGTPVPTSVGKEQLCDPVEGDIDRDGTVKLSDDCCKKQSALPGSVFFQPFSLWSIQQALTDMQRLSSQLVIGSASPSANFDSLPHELIHTIVNFLPRNDRTRTLARLSFVCKRLYNALRDPSMHTVVDLKPCWNFVNTACLDSISQRSQDIRKMRLSWLPLSVEIQPFLSSLQTNRLNTLLLSCCAQLTDDLLGVICQTQPHLAVLDLSSCRSVTPGGFAALDSLKNLRRLSLYRTFISDSVLVNVLQHLTLLEALNIGSLSKVTNMDVVLKCLSMFCPNLKALDCWRAKSLTHLGLRDLATGCTQMEELDLGWCGDVRAATSIFRHLAMNMPRLRRLLLTANRTICDADLDCFARYLFNSLEQLDILGCRDITTAGVMALLDRCPKLEFLDISFCASLDFEEVSNLRKLFPRCSIKKSYQP